jgi:hypothetical protein
MDNNEREFADIINYIRGKLRPERASKIRAQLRNSPVLQRLADAIRSSRTETVTDDWKALKSAAHALLDRQLRECRRRQEKEVLQSGVTIFDSRLLPIPEGIRPATVDTRHVRYQIGGDFLDLSFYPVSIESFEVIGRFTGAPTGSSYMATLNQKTKKYSTAANELGLFRFPRISRGEYVLEITDGVDIIGTVDFDI